MKINKPHRRFLAVILTACAGLGLVNSAHVYSVYRGVTADAGTGVVSWTVANFGVSAGPIPPPPAPPPLPTLSFFYFATDAAARLGLPAAQCFVKVDLVNTNNPNPNDNDTVGFANIPVGANAPDQARPFPWTIAFDNVPPGHWSIAKADLTAAASNAAAGRVAAAGFNTLATTANSGVTVVNGVLNNCGP